MASPKERVALVTGAGRGIGREIALGLAANGTRVGLLARSQDQLEAVAAEIHSAGGVALAVVADVGNRVQTRAALDQVTTRLGAVEVLVNNAAVVWPLGSTPDLEPEAVADALAINVTGLITVTARVLPGMIDGGWGRVVNVSSGIVDHPGMMVGGTVYAASKAAVEAHTINLAAELDGTGVTANVYRPGAVDTAMQEWIRAQPPEQIGVALHDRFTTMHAGGALLTARQSASALLARLEQSGSGEIWNAGDQSQEN